MPAKGKMLRNPKLLPEGTPPIEGKGKMLRNPTLTSGGEAIPGNGNIVV